MDTQYGQSSGRWQETPEVPTSLMQSLRMWGELNLVQEAKNSVTIAIEQIAVKKNTEILLFFDAFPMKV